MGLLIIMGRDGTPRPTWWGRISVKGSRRETNLNIPIEGTIPLSDSGRPIWNIKGDDAFEKSKKAAQKAFDAWRKEAQKDPAELAAKAYRARTGTSVEGVPLAKLADLWEKQKRTYTPTEDWSAAVRTWYERFARFARKYAADHGTRCETINDITPEIAGAWFDDLKKEFAWETITKQMSLMRGAFRRYSTNGKPNPFEDVVIRNRETGNARINRKPLTASEAERLFECSRDNETIHNLIVCAVCTGMRIGDVCTLKWENINLDDGFIDVLTAKTGKRVTIPIFDRLREVLEDCRPITADGTLPSKFVFPLAADWYTRNPDGIYQAAKPYFAQAVFGDTTKEVEVIAESDEPETHRTRTLDEVLTATDFTESKKARITEVYTRIKRGEKSVDIAAALGVARSQVSMDLAEIETLTGENLRPRAIASGNRRSRLALIKQTQITRGIGKRSASVYGWHSLRATFVVLAIEAGVPLPDVQKIVGHSTAEMTMQYFNPTAKHAAERVQKQMRGSILNGGRKDNQAMLGAPVESNQLAATQNALMMSSALQMIAAMTPEQQQMFAAMTPQQQQMMIALFNPVQK